jgi:adenylate/nucleoside-diphosphate kinase
VVPEDCVIEAIKVITTRAVCQSKGYCLDGYPLTIEQAKALEANNVVPRSVIHLSADQAKILSRSEASRQETFNLIIPELNAPDIIACQTKIYSDNLESIKELYSDGYNIWNTVDQEHSKWMTAVVIESIVKKSTSRRQTYLDLKRHGTLFLF